ncbi:MAG: carbohydrate ABC transporter permease [Anaerolineaceae bacterium]
MAAQTRSIQSNNLFRMGRTGYKRNKLINREIAFTILVFLGLLYGFPFYWAINTALKTDVQVFLWPPLAYPPTPQWQNFAASTHYIPFWLYIGNTMAICAISIVGTLLSCTVIAYGFARIKFRGRELMFMIYLSTIMLPAPVTMIPLYVLYSKLHWIGTYLPLVVPMFFGSVPYVFLLRQFFRTIPNELSEAAFIDGASEWKILWYVMLPLCKPALAAIALLTFIGKYQDYMGPLIYLTNSKQWTISLGLKMFQNMYGQQWQLMMSASVLSMMPMIILYFLTQRTLIEGVTMTGIKG